MICSMLRLTAAPRLSVHTVGSASLLMGLHAAARLAYFDRPTFATFRGTTSGLRSARERFIPLDDLDPTGIYGAFAE